MRIFAIRDGEMERPKELAYLLYYEGERTFYIELPENADEWETPLLLSSFVKRGETSINAYWSKLWVQQRIVPTDRQNLGQILRDNGLELYDEFALLMLADGRCAQDEYYLTELTFEELPEEIQNRVSKRVSDIVPLPNYFLLVFFSDGTIRKVNALELLEDIRTFAPVLGSTEVFQSVSIQPGGYGIRWGSTMNVSKQQLYEAGEVVPLTVEDFHAFTASRILSTSEACELLHCSRQNIDDLVRRGKLHPVKTGRTKLFFRSELEQRLWK